MFHTAPPLLYLCCLFLFCFFSAVPAASDTSRSPLLFILFASLSGIHPFLLLLTVLQGTCSTRLKCQKCRYHQNHHHNSKHQNHWKKKLCSCLFSKLARVVFPVCHGGGRFLLQKCRQAPRTFFQILRQNRAEPDILGIPHRLPNRSYASASETPLSISLQVYSTSSYTYLSFRLSL